ncbi:hypothetical protein K270103H11_13830 [Gordonibacter urolithinfaciens]
MNGAFVRMEPPDQRFGAGHGAVREAHFGLEQHDEVAAGQRPVQQVRQLLLAPKLVERIGVVKPAVRLAAAST